MFPKVHFWKPILVVILPVIFGYYLTNACERIITGTASTNCQAIPVSTSESGSTTPSILYSMSTLSSTGLTEYPSGSFGIVRCDTTNAMLTEQGTTNQIECAKILTCNNGAWTEPNTFTCRVACPDLTILNRDGTVTYANGHDENTKQSLPGATASVSCTANQLDEIFEGTVSTDSPSVSPVVYTCSANGQWISSSGAPHTTVRCLRKCDQRTIAIADPHTSYTGPLETTATGTAVQSTGQTFTKTVYVNSGAAATIPCGDTSYQIRITNNNGDTAHEQMNIMAASQSFVCYDGRYNLTITDATDGLQTGPVDLITCVATF